MEPIPPPQSLEGEARLKQLGQEVTRLKFDTPEGKIPDIVFDPNTGEDLRGSTEKLLQAQRAVLLPQAEAAMCSALDYKGDERFSVVTGAPFPAREIGQDDKITPESLQARLNVLRQDVKARVTNARKTGREIPKFDAQTGETIPEDSLRSLREVIEQESSERPWLPSSQEDKEDMADVNLALEMYRRYKSMKKNL